MQTPDTQNFPHLPEQLKGLEDLAENLWWSWNPQARMLFKMLDRQAWKESGHNPDLMLRNLPEDILKKATRDPNYMRHYDLVMYHFNKYLKEPPLSTQPDPEENAGCVAYFSAEYGLHHSLPFYAGGLGFLAGDHLKECSDMGVPLVALGFMYPAGYLYQVIKPDGWQENYTQEVDKSAASISPVYTADGGQLRVPISHINHMPLQLGIWEVPVGRVSLLLMDTDMEENEPGLRSISQRLYTSDPEKRLLQEIVLGIGGYRVLKALDIDCRMLHLNEGHAAFALLEKMRELVENGADFEQARQQLREMSLFTTHTPVPAGHDVFPFEMIEKYFEAYWPRLGLDREGFLDLGRHPDKPEAGFNMTALALKLSGKANGVSRRHGKVSRRMWQGMWPDLTEDQVPIDHVTNGVHLPSWLEPKMRLLFNKYFGEGWLNAHDNPAIWEFIEEIPNNELWQTHYWLKLKLIDYIRHKARNRWDSGQVHPSQITAMGIMLDPSVLTLGFARRFTPYKRPDLIFTDLERLKKMLNDPWRPIQLIFAGKSHPDDAEGHELIHKIFELARNPETAGRVAFVENYNEMLAQYLTHGVDVWLNNPAPPMEASGTSGMKAALNGVPHLSTPDGWWLEGYSEKTDEREQTIKNGWRFGSGEEIAERDGEDAGALYELLEKEIIPLYYRAGENGTPHGWVRVMKETIKTNAPRFSARRMIKDYMRKYYGIK
ncbi:MAG: alpha-glucan family phosphorylase [Desulfobacteraceae bacterium]|nr:alpha-glucan family phosphorylase [Desulfobacteraceae bacterium]